MMETQQTQQNVFGMPPMPGDSSVLGVPKEPDSPIENQTFPSDNPVVTSENNALPTADEFFGKSEELPTADQFLSKLDTPSWTKVTAKEIEAAALATVDYLGGGEWHSEEINKANAAFLSKTSFGRTLRAFGTSAEEILTGGGQLGFGLLPPNYGMPGAQKTEAEKRMEEIGLFPKGLDRTSTLLDSTVDTGQRIFKSLFVPAAVAVDASFRALSLPMAIGTAMKQGAKELYESDAWNKPLAKALAISLGMAGGIVEDPFGLIGAPINPSIARARAEGIIGEGEAGFRGRPPTKQQMAERLAFSSELPETEVIGTKKPATSIHEGVRNLRPELFEKRDALVAQKDELRATLSGLSDTRNAEAQEKIDAILGKVNGVEGRLTKTAKKRLDSARESMSADTTEMADIRKKIVEADYQLRDMAPEVSSAYREAEDLLSVERVAEAEAAPTTPQFYENGEPARPIQEQIQGIVDDVKGKLIKVGQADELANANAQLVAEHYLAISEQGWVKGTPEEIYNKYSPTIEGGAGGKKALHQNVRASFFKATEDRKALLRLMKTADASSFIHENGHSWLEEMASFVKLDDAPTQLKQDWQTVRDYLGIKDGEAITRKQHELFARAFENYMREGHAPSRNLVAVFEKFRTWLTSLYKTADRLRAPINDDIRLVFDRMLSSKPERTVIAEEREALRLEPASREVVKSPKTTEPAPPSVSSVAREEEGAPAVREVPTVQKVEEVGAALQGPKEIQVSPIPEPKTVGQTKEGTEALKPTESAPIATKNELEPVSGDPNALIAKPKRKFVDKAGNIRLDLLTDKEDIRQALLDRAEESGGFKNARRGVITDREVIDFAHSMGKEAHELNLEALRAFSDVDGIPFAYRIRGGRELLVQSSENATAIFKKVVETGSDADMLALEEARLRHLMIAETISGVTEEMGRAFRAFQDMSKEKVKSANEVTELFQRMTGATREQMLALAEVGANLDSPAKVSKLFMDTTKSSFMEKLIEFRTMNLVSGLITNAKNIIGSTITTVLPIAESALARGVGKVLGSTEGVSSAEGRARLYAILQSGKEAWFAAKAAFADESFMAASEKLDYGHRHAIPNKYGGKQIRIPGRALSAEDKFFKTIAYRQELNAQAYRQAEREGLAYDSKEFKDRVAQIVENPSDAIIEECERVAREQTFTESLGLSKSELSKWTKEHPTELYLEAGQIAKGEGYTQGSNEFVKRVSEITSNPSEEMMRRLVRRSGYMTHGEHVSSWARNHPILRFPFPFIVSPINILKYAGERTPIGLLSSEVRANISGVNGQVARDTQIARILMGSTIMTGAFAYALDGHITGGGPSDPKERAKLVDSGWQPYSIKLFGGYWSYGWAEPLSSLIGVPADMAEIWNASSEAEMGDLARMVVLSISQNVTNKMFLSGLSDMSKAWDQPDKYGEEYIRDLIVSFAVPNIVTQFNRAIDPVMRDARTTVDMIKSRIPGLSTDILPKRDVWGEERVREGSLGPDVISPIYVSHETKDPVKKALADLPYYPARLDRTIRDVNLTDEQYDYFQVVAGRMAKEQLNVLVAQDAFALSDTYEKVKAISSVVEDAREQARTIVMAEWPSIIEAALRDRALILSGEKPLRKQSDRR